MKESQTFQKSDHQQLNNEERLPPIPEYGLTNRCWRCDGFAKIRIVRAGVVETITCPHCHGFGYSK